MAPSLVSDRAKAPSRGPTVIYHRPKVSFGSLPEYCGVFGFAPVGVSLKRAFP